MRTVRKKVLMVLTLGTDLVHGPVKSAAEAVDYDVDTIHIIIYHLRRIHLPWLLGS